MHAPFGLHVAACCAARDVCMRASKRAIAAGTNRQNHEARGNRLRKRSTDPHQSGTARCCACDDRPRGTYPSDHSAATSREYTTRECSA
jgi:hypothetical protein